MKNKINKLKDMSKLFSFSPQSQMKLVADNAVLFYSLQYDYISSKSFITNLFSHFIYIDPLYSEPAKQQSKPVIHDF